MVLEPSRLLLFGASARNSGTKQTVDVSTISAASTTEITVTPRYELNGVLGPDEDLDRNIASITYNSSAWFTYNLGKFGVVVDGSVTKKASSTLDTSNQLETTGIDEGITSGRMYIIEGSEVSPNSWTSFGAADNSRGTVFTATRSSVAGDSALSGTAAEIVQVFSEDNMYGNLGITSAGFDSIVNRLTLKFDSDEQALQEEDQIVMDTRDRANAFYINPEIANAISNRDEPLLEKTTSLDLTRTNVQARRIGAIHINNSRQNIVADFTVDLTNIPVQAGDIVGIRHTTPGWGYEGATFDLQNPVAVAPKLFRVVSVEEEVTENNISLKISAQEYNNDNYTDGVVQEEDTAPNTNFPRAYRSPDIGSLDGRPQILEYVVGGASEGGDVDLSIESGFTIFADNLTIGATYKIMDLGDTTQPAWQLLAGTQNTDSSADDYHLDDYAVNEIFTSALSNTMIPLNVFGTAGGNGALVAGFMYTITSLGTG